MNKFKDILSRPDLFPLKKFIWKYWYNVFASKYESMNISLMNYGYVDENTDGEQLKLDSQDEPERYCYQLYNHVASAVNLEGLEVLEVGCGRGGGTSYIKRYLKPRSLMGVDFSLSNINFCRKNHNISGLYFIPADAEALPFKDDSFDVVVNVESSHCYSNMDKFLAEVYRVLRPNGNFLFTDFRPSESVVTTQQQLKKAGFTIVKKENITANVMAAMRLENQRKSELIKDNISKYMHWLAYWFAAAEGTPMYRAFESGKLEYVCYALKKQPVQIEQKELVTAIDNR
jgi:ubiquinone/menaquinone biosynthesis C-methylase UbiE